MEQQQLIKSDILYEDKFCKVTKREIKIHNYYFPTMTEKVLHMDEIEKVYLKENLGIFEKKLWGMPCANVFYPLDWSRFKKKQGIWIKPKSTNLKVGLTPDSEEDCKKLYRVLT